MDDLDRVAAVRDLLGPGGRIRVDANGGWNVAEAQHALGALAAYRLEYAEQPCMDVADLARLRVALARGGVDDRFTPGRISVARQARPELPGDRDGGPRLTAGHLVECADRDGAAGALGVLLLDVGQDRLDGLGAVGP